MAKKIDETNLGYLWGKIKAAFWKKTDIVQMAIDSTPTASSTNFVTSGGVKDYVDNAIPTVPAISTDISTDANSDAKTASPKAVKTYVDNAIPTVPSVSSNVATDKADNSKVAGAKAVYDEVHPALASSQPAGGLLPNVLYNLGTLTGSVTIALATPTDANVENEYKLTFDAGSTAPAITWPNSVTAWAGNCLDGNGDPELTAGKHYEVSIEGAYGVIVEF